MTVARNADRRWTNATGERCRDESGSASLELALLGIFVIMGFLLVSFGWRYHHTVGAVNDAAAEAARAASLRNPSEFSAAADAAAQESLASMTFLCGGRTVNTTGGSAAVTTTVTCSVPISDLTLLGVGGAITIEATETEVVDRYRGG